MDYTLEKAKSWIIVRDAGGYPVFRHNSGDEKAAIEDFIGIAGALGMEMKVRQPKTIKAD